MKDYKYYKAVRVAQIIELSNAGKFMVMWRGYEFSHNGKVVPKHYIYRWTVMTGREPGEFFTIKDKPGWHDGMLKDGKLYDDYLKNVNFVY